MRSVFVAVLLLAAPAARADPPEAVETALREGNRLFRAGRLEAAMEAYRAGWEADGESPVLAYNLGTTAHHLGRLPEAVLWYRRAERLSGGRPDRWLAENLERARRSLDASRLPPPAPWRWLMPPTTLLLSIAALAAWLCLGLVVMRPRLGGRAARVAVVAGLLAAVALAATVASRLLAPEPAVLIAECVGTEDRLPMGSEVWVRRREEGDYRVYRPHREPLVCPPESIILLTP